MSDRRGEILVAGLLATAGALYVWQAALLDLGNVALPGPGFFPLSLGAVLMAFAAAIGIGRWRSRAGEGIEVGHRDVLIVIGALLMVALLFEPLGAYITLGLFGTALLVLVARIRIPLAMLAAGLGMAICWSFFHALLGLRLPTGPL